MQAFRFECVIINSFDYLSTKTYVVNMFKLMSKIIIKKIKHTMLTIKVIFLRIQHACVIRTGQP